MRSTSTRYLMRPVVVLPATRRATGTGCCAGAGAGAGTGAGAGSSTVMPSAWASAFIGWHVTGPIMNCRHVGHLAGNRPLMTPVMHPPQRRWPCLHTVLVFALSSRQTGQWRCSKRARMSGGSASMGNAIFTHQTWAPTVIPILQDSPPWTQRKKGGGRLGHEAPSLWCMCVRKKGCRRVGFRMLSFFLPGPLLTHTLPCSFGWFLVSPAQAPDQDPHPRSPIPDPPP